MRFLQNKHIRTIVMASVIVVMSFMQACEDDPILEQNSSTSTGGSYGKIIMPTDSSSVPENPEVW